MDIQYCHKLGGRWKFRASVQQPDNGTEKENAKKKALIKKR